MELIKLPVGLGIKVNEILKEKIGFRPRENKVGLANFEYTSEELSQIDKLLFENPSNKTLEGIELLPNLKSLLIKSDGNMKYKRDKDITSISDKDIANISKCKKLEQLEIENQAQISYIDVSKMENLKVLSIKRNNKLDEICGLESLKELWELDCVGNESLTRIDNLDEIIMNNGKMTDLNLDVLLYPDAIGYDINAGNTNEDVIKKIDKMNTSWQEILSNNKDIKINDYQMKDMHRLACKALDEYVPKNCENHTAVVGIERYLAENIKYDHDALNNNQNHILNGIASGPLGGANGAYNAFKFNTCVCEGYTRAMQYLLRLRGIKSHNVSCIMGEDKLHMSNDDGNDKYKVYRLPDDGYHSIISIDDMNFLYDDPCWNAGRYQRGDKTMPWTLLTKEEISKDHTLSFNEKNIDNNHLSVSRDTINTDMQRIDKHRKQVLENNSINPNELKKQTLFEQEDIISIDEVESVEKREMEKQREELTNEKDID